MSKNVRRFKCLQPGKKCTGGGKDLCILHWTKPGSYRSSAKRALTYLQRDCGSGYIGDFTSIEAFFKCSDKYEEVERD